MVKQVSAEVPVRDESYFSRLGVLLAKLVGTVTESAFPASGALGWGI